MSPRVGKTHYGYDAKGRAAAKKASKRTGRPVKNAKPKMRGKRGGSR